eukprot:gnl/TRDRNA2_/TRDRNA2_183724_c0_seq1.p1 gnl/TRDRNA2_/TRDRNA2_183724_c0~~gnl/TRDRNA2_/TRDRNA2_183724_c0_seq1.p1  ORF type:complete len:191 (+),score=6.78 gnl/TRDRNA2_/TRDRNA2_183724_c0_seq1:163-735(+)
MGFSSSTACGCCVSLRSGSFMLCCFAILLGISLSFTPHWLAVAAGLLYIAVGCFGLWAAYRGEQLCLSFVVWAALVFVGLAILCMILFLLYWEQFVADSVDTSVCNDAKNERACKQEIRHYFAQRIVDIWWMRFIFIMAFDLWLALVFHSYRRVLEIGWSGDEGFSAEQLKAIQKIEIPPPTETTRLQTA